ncbi:MAG: transposase [Gammaproteobacteria bacterium]|nr:transposase [Gammaproteobacteria bacterium]
MLRHLRRYTHRIAIGNERLLGCENDEVAESAQVDFAAIRRLTLITPRVTITE